MKKQLERQRRIAEEKTMLAENTDFFQLRVKQPPPMLQPSRSRRMWDSTLANTLEHERWMREGLERERQRVRQELQLEESGGNVGNKLRSTIKALCAGSGLTSSGQTVLITKKRQFL